MIFPFDVISWIFGGASNGIGNFLTGLGGKIAAGFESGVLAIVKDIWTVVRPFLYIVVGVIIAGVATGWFFTGQVATPQMIAAALSVVK